MSAGRTRLNKPGNMYYIRAAVSTHETKRFKELFGHETTVRELCMGWCGGGGVGV